MAASPLWLSLSYAGCATLLATLVALPLAVCATRCPFCRA
jgi:ABC-type phosphate/phosphonate transport system permease subunit